MWVKFTAELIQMDGQRTLCTIFCTVKSTS